MTDPTKRFSNRVTDYVRYRPRYPQGTLALVQEKTGLKPSWAIADVGSGTGFSSEAFLRNGNVVFGIEPNNEMRAAAETLLDSYPNFRSVAGTAEATGLEDASVELVTGGQAFHWFDPQKAKREFACILKPPGWVVVIWNRRRTTASAFLIDYEKLLNRFGTDYAEVRHDHTDFLSGFFDGTHEHCSLPNEQVFDFTGLKGRLLSSSYVPTQNEPNYLPMLAELERIFSAHQRDGCMRFEYDTDFYFGRIHSNGKPAK